MAKRNTWLAQQQEKIEEKCRITQYLNERQCIDAMMLALHEEFGFGKERLKRFVAAYVRERSDMAYLFLDDRWNNNDEETVYAKEKTDRTFRQIMGDDYPTFDKRHIVDVRKPMFDGGIYLE